MKMAADSMKILWLIVAILSVTVFVHSTEQGKWTRKLDLKKDPTNLGFYKTLYNRSSIFVSITCSEKSQSKLNVRWILRWSPCAEEYLGLDGTKDTDSNLLFYYDSPNMNQIEGFNYDSTQYIKSEENNVDCGDHIELTPYTKISDVKTAELLQMKQKEQGSRKKREGQTAAPTTKPSEKPTTKTPGKPITKPKPTSKPAEKVVTKPEGKPPSKPKPTSKPTENVTTKPKGKSTTKAPVNPIDAKTSGKKGEVCRTWREGVFLLVLRLSVTNDSADTQVNVTVQMKNDNGYLSAMEWPLLVFYGVMCIVYVVLGLIWLVLLACNWRDLLRVQFWIGGVIVLGMLEKAVFYAEYQNINHKGESVPGAIIFAELVSCFKRTVARMLVIIVSLGFGIVKPRLGPMLHKVLGVGSLYFIFAAAEGCFRTIKSKYDMSKNLLLAAIPLALIDAIICWWIFTSLVQTLRTLRLRRNIVKLSLYRHFTNTLVFAVLASIAFMVWSYTQHRLKICLTDWKELWVDDAYWHLLFSVILIVIMVLWRPTVNNQRYAFSPLLDAADDEADEDIIMSDAFEGMKMRGARNGSPRQSASSKAEDDLKWVEENIPSTLIDKAIPGVIDSDEEIVTTKLEMAKME